MKIAHAIICTTAALAAALYAREWPDAGGAHEYASLDWTLIERDIANWRRLPPLTATQSVNVAACILPGDKVTLELSPYDLSKGRIIWRDK